MTAALDQALRRALAREPSERFDSVAAFLSAGGARGADSTPMAVEPEANTPRSIAVLPLTNLSRIPRTSSSPTA